MVQQLSPQELKERLAREDAAPLVLDVREDSEREICALPDSTHIPMGQIPERIEELDRNREIVVQCHHGIRSMQVAVYLERQGFTNVYNLDGGIDAWANEIDPSMATY
jgi:rhodanese-related sulfurtransferase